MGRGCCLFAVLWAVFMAAIFALISVAGPHSTPWPKPMQTLVYVLAGLAILVLPALAARAAFRSVCNRTAASRSKKRHAEGLWEVTPNNVLERIGKVVARVCPRHGHRGWQLN